MPPNNTNRNIEGTTSDSFTLGVGGPTLERVSGDRLKLPDNSRFEPSGSGEAGFVTTDGSGNMSVGSLASVRDITIHLENGIGPAFVVGGNPLFREITPLASPFPTSVIWYEDNTKAKKILECAITRASNQQITQTVLTLYDTDGITPLETATDVITYDVSGVFEVNRTRVFTP